MKTSCQLHGRLFWCCASDFLMYSECDLSTNEDRCDHEKDGECTHKTAIEEAITVAEEFINQWRR